MHIHSCLPQALLNDLKNDPVVFTSESAIFRSQFEEFRRKVILRDADAPGRMSIDADIVRTTTLLDLGGWLAIGNVPFLQIIQDITQFRATDFKSYLHSAAYDEDLPLAYELIRMGIDIDRRDNEGVTALVLALAKLLLWQHIALVIALPGVRLPDAPSPTYIANKMECLVRISTLLVEQHADVNAGAYGFTPLSLAVTTGKWDLVKLLIRHGARVQKIIFSCDEDKSRLAAILRKTNKSDPRPPRPCPCWSGRLLSQCHDVEDPEQPYPDYFLCGCGRHKTHGQCCRKRGLVFKEGWDPQNGRITSCQVCEITISTDTPLVSPGTRDSYAEGIEALAKLDLAKAIQDIPFDSAFKDSCAQLKDIFIGVGKNPMQEVDPAFWYALSKVHFFPRPDSKDWKSLVENHLQRQLWNDAVDEYIATMNDHRPRFEIEKEAKIDSRGGPLYRRCERKGCSKYSERDVKALQWCSGCCRILYCSQQCQRNDWADHRTVCTAGNHPFQRLRSQWNLEQLVICFVAAVPALLQATA